MTALCDELKVSVVPVTVRDDMFVPLCCFLHGGFQSVWSLMCVIFCGCLHIQHTCSGWSDALFHLNTLIQVYAPSGPLESPEEQCPVCTPQSSLLLSCMMSVPLSWRSTASLTLFKNCPKLLLKIQKQLTEPLSSSPSDIYVSCYWSIYCSVWLF